MAITLFVGNLPFALTEQELADAFCEVAPVQAVRIIIERETGRSKGFAFVEVTYPDASRVVEALNGAELRGRKIRVIPARPRLPQS